MKVIWKYTINLKGHTRYSIPDEYKIIACHMQKNEICIWVIVDPDNKVVSRKFWVFGTGEHIENYNYDYMEYIGTVFQERALYVWHIFMEK